MPWPTSRRLLRPAAHCHEPRCMRARELAERLAVVVNSVSAVLREMGPGVAQGAHSAAAMQRLMLRC
jgi:hypothetical protein